MALYGTLWFLCGIFILHLTISLLFIQGFFLSKNELLINSECDKLPLDSNTEDEPLENSPYNIDYAEIFGSLDTDFNGGNDEKMTNKKCWTEPKYEKVIIMIIDALKFDFVSPLIDDKDIEIKYYSHKLTSIHNLLENNTSSYHSKLFRFISDPPTVTAQRIKGFTTGGLPTFFDVRNSFSSSKIVIDNILYQLKINGNYNISFMGDDTWNDLFDYKLYFDLNHPFPSFDVYDLYTVDNGCKEYLYPSLYDKTKLKEWNVLISHFLGVDHVGHRYYMNHPKMAEKLNEMNDIIKNVTLWIDQYKIDNPSKDILLMIFGDHGMTKTGDHGGATIDETNAALFMYSTKTLYPHYPFKDDNNKAFREVTQINIVPTLSLLMGVPIPFENIGAIIPEFYLEINNKQDSNTNNNNNVDMNVLLNSWKDLLKAISLNAFQVYQYLWTYDNKGNSDTFSDSELLELYDKLKNPTNDLKELSKKNNLEINDIQNIVGKFQIFLKDAYNLCLRKWTTFNLHIMGYAIFIGLCAVIGLNSMCIDMNSSDTVKECHITLLIWSKYNMYFDIPIFLLNFLYIKQFFYQNYSLYDPSIFIQVFAFSMGSNFAITLCHQYMSCTIDWSNTFNRFDSIAMIILVIMYFQGLFTDTYVKYEPQLVLFLIIISLIIIVISSYRQHNDIDIASKITVR